MDLVQMQKSLQDYTKSLFLEGILDSQFLQLQQLQDESNPDFVSHEVLITVEEGSIGGFGSHVVQFLALDGLLDGKLKWRPMVLPDRYIEHGSPMDQLAEAGLTASHIAATALNLMGTPRQALFWE